MLSRVFSPTRISYDLPYEETIFNLILATVIQSKPPHCFSITFYLRDLPLYFPILTKFFAPAAPPAHVGLLGHRFVYL